MSATISLGRTCAALVRTSNASSPSFASPFLMRFPAAPAASATSTCRVSASTMACFDIWSSSASETSPSPPIACATEPMACPTSSTDSPKPAEYTRPAASPARAASSSVSPLCCCYCPWAASVPIPDCSPAMNSPPTATPAAAVRMPPRLDSTSLAAPSAPAVRSSVLMPTDTSSSSSVAIRSTSLGGCVGAAHAAVVGLHRGEHLLPVLRRLAALVPLGDEVLRGGLLALAAVGVGDDRGLDAMQQVQALGPERAGDPLIRHPLRELRRRVRAQQL